MSKNVYLNSGTTPQSNEMADERIVYIKPPFWKRLFTKQPKVKPVGFKAILWHWIKKIVLWFFLISIGSTILLKWIPIPFTWTMVDRKISAMSDGEASEINYDWMSYSELSKEAAIAVVAAEDQFFPQHNGFDFKAMNTAFSGNLKGKRLKGASTISQQTAKNVFLWQNRSYFRKVLEVYFTLLIELVWGKERILEVYLNVAETGKMTFGFEAGSMKYFGHSASSLSRTEAAKMAAVLPSPNKYSVTNPSRYIQKRVNFISRQIRALGGPKYLDFNTSATEAPR